MGYGAHLIRLMDRFDSNQQFQPSGIPITGLCVPRNSSHSSGNSAHFSGDSYHLPGDSSHLTANQEDDVCRYDG